MINGGWKCYFGLKNNSSSQQISSCGIIRNSSLRLLSLLLSYMVVKFEVAPSLEDCREGSSKS